MNPQLSQSPTAVDQSRFLKREWIQLLILLAPFVAIAIYWNAIPDIVPSHWSLSGKVNGHSSKVIGVLLLPLMNIGIALLLAFLPRFDPKRQIGIAMRPIKALRLTITGFLTVLSMLMLAVALGKPIDMALMPGVLLPLLFLIIGNYLPQTRPNYFVGVRTPWTLEDPENWRLTHALAGKLWVIASICVLLLELLIPTAWVGYLLTVYFVAIIAIPLIYSFLIYRRKQSAMHA